MPVPSGPLTGKLLLATPALVDPNFHRTVVLLCAHNEDGAFGLVINRPLKADLIDHLPQWRHRAASPPRVFEGGPVQRDVALALARVTAVPAELWTGVSEAVGLVDLSREPEEFPELEELRIFSGYAGWGASQLESEIEQDSWFVVESEDGDAFSREPEALWSTVLRRQPGRLAMFTHFPGDPQQN